MLPIASRKMSAPARTDILDHIVYLIAPGKLDEGVARFKAIGFNVLPGGTHADGLTYNALVVLADGVYLELIAFVHPISYYPPDSPERAAREGHGWAKKTPGWIDFAHLDTTPDPSSTFEIINRRSPTGESVYANPLPGGRKRPDGVVLKWTVTPPEAAYGRGILPFFCQDLTPRTLRVPLDPPSNAAHPNTAQGVATVEILVAPSRFEEYVAALEATTGSPPQFSTTTSAAWPLGTPNKDAKTSPLLRLQVSEGGVEREEEDVLAAGGGIYKVSFWVEEEVDKLDTDTLPQVTWKSVAK